jgi:diaminopimelate epimerase
MRLTKHHGLGNDFLVLLDADGSKPLPADQVRTLCDRHRGVGADGLIRATRPTAGDAALGLVARMQLVNADGSPAEMSGNGIRCLAQALVMAGWATGPEVAIATDAGVRTVTIHEQVDATTQISSVDMGPAEILGDAPEWSGGPFRRALLVDVGNPHLVLDLAPDHAAAADHDTGVVRLVELGERVNGKLSEGANVHLLTDGGRGSIVIRTYERGVGPTLACGTGACAAAAAARRWGVADDPVVVRMAGGEAQVTLGEAGVAVELRGPATAVAAIDVPVPTPVGA